MEVQFTEEIEQLQLGAGATFHGEGILAITKGLLQAGVAYIGGYQGAPVSHLTSACGACQPRRAHGEDRPAPEHQGRKLARPELPRQLVQLAQPTIHRRGLGVRVRGIVQRRRAQRLRRGPRRGAPPPRP